jgi:hypothetical protein
MVRENKMPSMTIGRAALLGLMRRYLSAVMDPTVTLLEIHKLMYFMQDTALDQSGQRSAKEERIIAGFEVNL